MSSFFPRGVAVPDFKFQLVNKTTGAAVTTGTPTAYVTKDSGAQAAATNTPTHVGNGEWKVTLTAAERDAKITSLLIVHTDAVPFHVNIVSDDQLGPGAYAVLFDLGTVGAFANIWLLNDSGAVVASGETDATGEKTFYLDAATYLVCRQKSGVNFDSNPYTAAISAATTIDLSSYSSEAEATTTANTYATVADGDDYFATRLRATSWTDATSSDKNKALAQAHRAINLLRFQGDPTKEAYDVGNQFPRGTDTEVPDEIMWAELEEAFALLQEKDLNEEMAQLNVLSDKFAGAHTIYDRSNSPEHIRSGILSATAWNFLRPYLRDERSVRLVRV